MQFIWSGDQGSNPFIKDTGPLGVSCYLLLRSALKRQKKGAPLCSQPMQDTKISFFVILPSPKLSGWFRDSLNLRWERRRPSGSRIYSFILFKSLHLRGVSHVPVKMAQQILEKKKKFLKRVRGFCRKPARFGPNTHPMGFDLPDCSPWGPSP